MLADAIPLAPRPQAYPLRDGQVFAGERSANRILDVEGDGDRFYGLAVGRGTPRDRNYRARKMVPAARARVGFRLSQGALQARGAGTV